MNFTIRFSTVWIIISIIVQYYTKFKNKNETYNYKENEDKYLFCIDKSTIHRTEVFAVVLFICFILDDNLIPHNYSISIQERVIQGVLVAAFIAWRRKYYNYKVDLNVKNIVIYNRDSVIFNRNLTDLLYVSENRRFNRVWSIKIHTKSEESFYLPNFFVNFNLIKTKIQDFKNESREKGL